MELTQVSLILADISGYTSFVTMHRVSLLHAEQIVTELLEAVISQIEDPLILNKLEGDAAFLYARAVDAGLAKMLLDKVLVFFTAFKARQQELIKAGEGGCSCEACCNIDQLKLKVVAHYGQAVIKQVRHLEELAGSDVILAHRLLKNKIPSKEYLLLTERFYQWSGGLPGPKPEVYKDDYEGIGTVQGRVYYPESPALEIPDTPRFTRLAGVLEGLKLFPKNLRQRLFHPRTFHNLSY
ncbi:MAG: DUF2652 domain-containing protein [Thermodesulfobacteriota bacterium]